MRKFRVGKVSALAILIMLAAPRGAHAYYGRHSTEAMLTYEATADVALTGHPTVEMLNDANGRTRKAALEKIDAQVQHLMGTFQSQSFKDEFPYPGVLGEKYDVQFENVEQGSAPGRLRLTYRYSGKVVFQKEAFNSSETREVPIKLPLAPDKIYALGVRHGKNLCTDEHYNSEGDFWYFWDPDMPGCPLKGNDTDVIRTRGTLRELPNTTLTYPEYDKLYKDNGNGDALDIAVFFGYIDDVDSLRTHTRHDDALTAMKYVESDLLKEGYDETFKKDNFREYADGRVVKGINHLHRFEKTVHVLGHDVTVRVQVMVADTMITSHDDTFHHYLVPAFENDDVVVYDGHSGLGGNLDLGELPHVKFRADKYQLFYFNGCSSYPYFNGMYFNAKGGTKNLDVVTSGLETLTETSGPNALTFIRGFLDGSTLSYQTILSRLETSNGQDGTYLTGVSGDEDNSFRP